jgi:hypothetical protein
MQKDIVPSELKRVSLFLKDWAYPKESERIRKRLNSSPEELAEFHDAVLPYLEKIIETLNQYPLDNIPAELKPYGYLALMMAEIDLAVNRFNSSAVPYGYPLDKLRLVHEEEGNYWA